jgi:hypothetical protein
MREALAAQFLASRKELLANRVILFAGVLGRTEKILYDLRHPCNSEDEVRAIMEGHPVGQRETGRRRSVTPPTRSPSPSP